MIRHKSLFVLLVLIFCARGYSQTTGVAESRIAELETEAEKKDAEPDDDSYELDLDEFSRHPMNLNTVSEEEFIQLHILNALQVRNFFSYRKLLGSLLTVYELQAVPGWDIETIHKLLPYIMVGRDKPLYATWRERSRGGEKSFLMRVAQVLEKSKGFEKPSGPNASYYTGSPQKIFTRYIYNYKQLLLYGFTGDKDAGEPFFRGAQLAGFDFYSFHFFLQQMGIIRALALGDFTVNMGQGLIQWQSFSFTKSGQALAIKREAAFLKPYHSAGEFNFHRGIGISLQKGNWQTSLFISSQRISTNLEPDTAGREDPFSSFQNSGYHRTPSEIADRNNCNQFSAGGNIRYSRDRIQLGFNWIHFHFSRPFQKRNEPYNLYSLKGNRLTDYSLDYNYTMGNMHVFGEIASDQWQHFAFVQGALISLSENLDLSFLYRNIPPAFQSLYGDAFTENSVPNNEKGFYAGLSFRPAARWQVNLFYDVFVFPWLTYGVDAPSAGRDIFLQLNYQPNQFIRFTVLYKNELKTGNADVPNAGTHEIKTTVKQRWRIETDYQISRDFSLAERMEFLKLNPVGDLPRNGFLGLMGLNFKRPHFSGNAAITMFETDNYDTRIYAYEPDVLYNFSLPVYYGKGIHYYVILQRDMRPMASRAGKHFHLSVGLKWEQVFYQGILSLGSGLDEIPGNRKSQCKAQVLIGWQ